MGICNYDPYVKKIQLFYGIPHFLEGNMDNGRFVHYKIDIEVIQKEHSIIIEQFKECFAKLDNKKENSIILDRFNECFAKLENREDIAPILEHIYDIILIHFQHEEDFMALIKYPFVENHKNEHKKFAFYFRKSLDNASVFTQTRYFVSTLQEHFLKHIDEQDRQIESYYYTLTK
jgi:hemerythrin-like metal-binding protein